MKLRYYQEEAVQSIWGYFATKAGNPILALPTGTGKSVIIAELLRRAFLGYADQRVLVLTHVKELLEQNLGKLLTLWPAAPAGVYSAGLKRRDTTQNILFCGIASIARNLESLGVIDLVIVDECHLISHKSETMYGQTIASLLSVNPNLKVIGLSATPYRLGLGHLMEGGLFTDVCYDLTGRDSFNRLVEEGYLARLVTKKTYSELDVSGVHLQGGEFVQKELQAAVDKASVTELAIQEIIHYGQNRKHWLIFSAGVEHAKHIAEFLTLYGVPAAALHSDCSDEERVRILGDFKAGRLRAVVNNNILTTGFDFPGIDLIGVLRPTNSAVLWIQMLGRGTRPEAGKANCLVLDFAGNTRRLGPINDPVLPRKKGKKGPGQAPVRVCETCGTYNHASARVCEECGAEFPRELRLANTAYTEEVMASSQPQVEVFRVDKVSYTPHEKIGRPPSMQVSYYCGLRLFREYICIEHPGFAGKHARDWWRVRMEEDPPESTAGALALAPGLQVPKAIHVHINTKYPEIVNYDF